jgi:hypothetical protein
MTRLKSHPSAAAFCSARKGNAPVPKKKLTKARSAKAIVFMVNEFNTSFKCHNCCRDYFYGRWKEDLWVKTTCVKLCHHNGETCTCIIYDLLLRFFQFPSLLNICKRLFQKSATTILSFVSTAIPRGYLN